MTLQTTINRLAGYGIPGDEVLNGPRRGHPVILNSTDATNNVPGRVMRYLNDEDMTVSADLAYDAQNPIQRVAGLLCNYKVYAGMGTTIDSLASDQALPNGTIVELLTYSSGVFVFLNNTSGFLSFGEQVYYLYTNGIPVASDQVPPIAFAGIYPNAFIVSRELNGVAGGIQGIIELNS